MTTENETPVTKPSIFRKILMFLGLAIFGLVAGVAIALAVGVNIDLTPYKGKLADLIQQQISHPVSIEGDIRLRLSFRPEIEVNQIEIANIPSIEWQPTLKVGHASAKVAVLPLLDNQVYIDFIDLKDIHLYLAKDFDGHSNWESFQANSEQPQTLSVQPHQAWSLNLGERIHAENLSVVYDDQLESVYLDWFLDTFDLTKDGKLWKLNTQGATLGQAYDLAITGELESILNHQSGKLDIQGSFAGAALSLSSEIHPLNEGLSTASLQLDWQDTGPIEALLGWDVYHIAPLHISANLAAQQGHLSVKDLTLDSPATQASGYLEVTLGDINTIDGKLDVPVIDLRPWLQPEPEQHAMGFASAPPQKSPLQRALDQWLVATHTNLNLTIGEILGLGTDINSLSLSVVGKEGKLSAPLAANIAQVPFQGNAEIDATEWSSRLNIELGAKDSSLGELASWLAGMDNARGHLDNALLTVSTEGTKLKEWISNSDLSFDVDNAHVEWAQDASFAIDKARFRAGMNIPVDIDIHGKLQGVPATITADAGALSDIVNRRDWQTTLTLASPVLQLSASGTLPQTKWGVGSQFALQIHSPDIAKLSPWLGTQAQATGPLKFGANLVHQGRWITFESQNLQLMDSKGKFNLKWQEGSEQGLVNIDAQFDKLDFNQLALLAKEESLPEVEQAVPTKGVNLSVPLLSNDIHILDANLSLKVNQVLWAQQRLERLSFSGKIRNGMMSSAPFSMRFANSLLKGDLSLSVDAAKIHSELNLSASKPDISEMAKTFGVADDMKMSLDSAKIRLALSGKTLLEFMETTEVDALLQGGYLEIPDIYTGRAMTIHIAEGRFHTGPERSTELLINGDVSGKDTQLQITSVSLKEANQLTESLPADLIFNIGDIAFKAQTQLSLPLDFTKLSLKLSADIPNLDRLNEFTGVALPPYGPIKLSAELSLDEVQYQLKHLILNVGNSELEGSGHLRPLGRFNRPDIALSLSSDLIQMDDFKVGNWRAWLPNDDKKTKEPEETKPTEQKQPLVLSPEGLSWANLELSLDVNNVRSGNDWLGATEARLKLTNGKMTVSPLKIRIPGGSVSLAGEIAAQEELFDIAMQGQVHRFDYGVIARRIDNKTDMGGELSTYFNLTSLANTPDSLMNNANGFIGFAVWPKEFEADLIDLWAVNLTDAILPSFTEEQESVLNCVAGGFDVQNGEMSQRDVLLDTTRIQVNGSFNASYPNRTFDLYLTPRPKSAQIFSLQTPVEVSGSFEDFDFNVPLSAILETSVRFTTSPVISPIRWLVEKPLQSDGSHVCEAISRGIAVKQ